VARKGKEAAEKNPKAGNPETAGKDPKNGGTDPKDPKSGSPETAGKDPKNGGTDPKDPKSGNPETAGKDPKNGGTDPKDPKSGNPETAGKDPKNGGTDPKDPKSGNPETAGKDPKNGGTDPKDPKSGNPETAGKDPKSQKELEETMKKGGEAAQKEMEKALKNLDPESLKDLAEKMKNQKLDGKEMQEALEKAMKEGGKPEGGGSELAKELAEKLKGSETLKEMAKDLAGKVDPETLAKFAEKFGKPSPVPNPESAGGGEDAEKNGDWIRGLKPDGEKQMELAERAAEKAENRLNGKEGPQVAGGPKGDGKEPGADPGDPSAGDGGPGTDGGGEWNPLARTPKDPSRRPVDFHDEKVVVPVGPGDPANPTGETFTAEPGEGQARVAFEKVLVKYRADMEKAMDDEAYPEEYRRAVRDYFDSLK